MTGGQLRTVRLLEQCTAEFDVALYSVSDTADLSAMSQSAALRTVGPVRILPKPGGQPPMWGSSFSDARQPFRRGLPAAVSPVGADATIAALRTAVATDGIEIVWCETQRLGEIARAAGIGRIVVDLDNLDALTLQNTLRDAAPYRRRAIHRATAAKYRRYEFGIAQRFAAVLVCKETDRENLSPTLGDRVFVVPNGISIPTNGAQSPTHGSPTGLFVGTLSWEPNTDAIEWLIKEYVPLMLERAPQFMLKIVGRGPVPARLRPLLGTPGIEVVVSPEVIAPFYHDANFVLAPLRRGGGTSIKSMEALAFGVPLIATDVAVRGLDFLHEEHYLRAEVAHEFVEASLRVLERRNEAASMAARGRDFVSSRYSWDAVGAHARGVVRLVLSGELNS